MIAKKYIIQLFLFITVLIILAAGNFYVFKHRDDGFLYHYVNYNSLYVPKELPAIVGFDFLPGRKLGIRMSSRDSRVMIWRCSVDNQVAGPAQKSVNPVIILLPGTHVYRLVTDGKELDFQLNIEFVGSDKYAAAGYLYPDNCHIINSTIPIVDFHRYPIDYLTYKKSIYPAADVKEGMKILRNEIKIDENDSTEKKILKIALFMHKKFRGLPGIPNDKMKTLTPLEQYKFINAGKSGLWCSNYAMIYTFFATCANIPSRLVALKSKFEGVQLTGHIFAESFIREQGRWARVDVISNIFLVKNRDGNVLNTIDILHMVISNTPGRCITFGAENNIVIQKTYSDDFELEKTSFNRNVNCVYYFPYLYHHALFSKVSHYMLKPDLAYSLSASNTGHYIKLSLFYGTILIFLFFVYFLSRILLEGMKKGVVISEKTLDAEKSD